MKLSQSIKDQIAQQAKAEVAELIAYKDQYHQTWEEGYTAGATAWAIYKQRAKAYEDAFLAAQKLIAMKNGPPNRSDLEDNSTFEMYRDRCHEYEQATQGLLPFIA